MPPESECLCCNEVDVAAGITNESKICKTLTLRFLFFVCLQSDSITEVGT